MALYWDAGGRQRRPALTNALRFAASISVLVVGAACSSDDGPGVDDNDQIPGAATDSAASRLEHDPDPILVIGGAVDGDAPDLFRVAGAARLESGRLVVGNAGNHELLFYSADGQYLARAGGSGGGPGEFRALSGIARLAGDSILALDNGLRRLTVFDDSGRAVRSAVLPAGPSNFSLEGTFDDGSILLRTRVSVRPEAASIRRPNVFVRYSRDGAVLDTVGTYPGLEIYAINQGVARALRAVAFSRETYAAVAGDRLFVGTGDEAAIHVRDAHGNRIGLIAWDRAPIPVTEHDRALHREQTIAATRPNLRRRRERDFERGDVRYPEVFPAHRRILAAADGRVWVQTYPRPGDRRQTWRVFRLDGTLADVVQLGSGHVLLEAGADYLLLYAQDASGVESIRLHRLHHDQ